MESKKGSSHKTSSSVHRGPDKKPVVQKSTLKVPGKGVKKAKPIRIPRSPEK